jgi:hypothetical protein
MDWFERLTGFPEKRYEDTRAKLTMDGTRLRSLVNGKSYEIGSFETPSLEELRCRAARVAASHRRSTVRIVRGEARRMHSDPQYRGALFQVASQFNALEMTGEEVTPEEGVTRYQGDHTQGPACAIAAGAATIWRNYFVPVKGGLGQTATRQIDNLADVGAALYERLETPSLPLWNMQNGHALCNRQSLRVINKYLTESSDDEWDALRSKLRIALQADTEVTDGDARGQLVSQAFCSALPIAYTSIPAQKWRPFASLVLEASYEATMLAAVLNRARGGSNVVLLTQLGGGAFGNEEDVILAAMRRAIGAASNEGLDIRIVTYGAPGQALENLVETLE